MDKDSPEFQQKPTELQISCYKAQNEILFLVQKNKENVERKTRSRLEKIDKELLALHAAEPEESN